MSYKKETLIKQISNNLAFASKSTLIKNAIGLFDSNRIAQNFYAGLFSLVFGYNNLVELDKLNGVVTYPAIDLGDQVVGIAFQITTEKTSKKIKDTIEKFNRHELYKKYSRLIVYIVGNKQNTYTSFNTDGKFAFDKDFDIWDDDFLIKEIDKLDPPKCDIILSFLKENLENFMYPDSLSPEDIKQCIGILKKDFGSLSALKNALKRNGDDFIAKKNQANSLSWEFFKEKIQGHLQYNKNIYDFLSDSINSVSQKDYLEVTAAIQEFYKDPLNDFTSFEDVFGCVFNKINLYDYSISGVSNKLKILLHNMYFNCDIGDNPLL